MNKYPSPVIMTVFALVCITIGVLIAYFGEKYDANSPPKSPAGPTMPVGGYNQSAAETWPEVDNDTSTE